MKSTRSSIGCRYFSYGFCILMVVLLSAFDLGSASTWNIHRPLINDGAGKQYYYDSAPTYRPRDRMGPAGAATITQSRPYQRYVACSPGTFLVRGCSLCVCTDAPMIAYCWDYQGQDCRDMRILAEEQTRTRHNDPNGVW